jgi:hypothetical protein
MGIDVRKYVYFGGGKKKRMVPVTNYNQEGKSSGDASALTHASCEQSTRTEERHCFKKLHPKIPPRQTTRKKESVNLVCRSDHPNLKLGFLVLLLCVVCARGLALTA